MDRLSKFRQYSLALAETVDAWRIIPRLMIVAYGALVVNLYSWYKSIPTFMQQKCDAAVLQIFITGGMALHDAQALACTVIDVVGGPTPAQSTFVTTIIGLSTGIFGLYTATGKKWEQLDFNYHQFSQFGPPNNGNYNGYDIDSAKQGEVAMGQPATPITPSNTPSITQPVS